jgi:flagellar basal body L-ring protein FlgH
VEIEKRFLHCAAHKGVSSFGRNDGPSVWVEEDGRQHGKANRNRNRKTQRQQPTAQQQQQQQQQQQKSSSKIKYKCKDKSKCGGSSLRSE